MSIENPTNGSAEAVKKSSLEQTVQIRIRWWIDSFIYENPDAPHNTETYLKGLEQYMKTIKEVAPDKENELLEVYSSVAEKSSEDVEKFVLFASEKMTDFFVANFSFEEIEEWSRRGKKMLNRLIEYNINDEKVEIHVPLTLVGNAIELRSLFVDALSKLADKCQNDPEFKDTKKVYAQSWIVYKVRKSLERLGFTVVELNRENRPVPR